MKSASVYARGDAILVHPLSEGVGTVAQFIHDPFLVLPAWTSDQELGEAVLSAISSSMEGVPWPDAARLKGYERQQWTALGARSRYQFSAGALLVSVDAVDGQDLMVRPTAFAGPRVGWQWEGEPLPVGEQSPEAIGRVVRSALNLSS